MKRLKPEKVIAGCAGAAMTFLSSVPSYIKDCAMISMMFIFVDTLAGLALSYKLGMVRSKTMGQKLLAKMLQYALLVSLFGGVAVLTHNWVMLGVGFGAVVTLESISILENLTLLERYGGVSLKPIKPLLDSVSKRLAVTCYNDEDGKLACKNKEGCNPTIKRG